MVFKLRKYILKLSKCFEVVGGVALLLMMVVTGIDVVGVKLFSSPLPGSIDVVMYSQLVAVGFAVAPTFIAGRHINVPFLITRLPVRVQLIIKSAIAFLGFMLFGLLAWQSLVFGNHLRSVGEYSPVIRIPIYPFAYGIVLTCLPLCLMLLLELYEALIMLVRGEGK